ncbi:hypothetical protein CHUAL_011588 [Chamberlinius hualienensis]
MAYIVGILSLSLLIASNVESVRLITTQFQLSTTQLSIDVTDVNLLAEITSTSAISCSIYCTSKTDQCSMYTIVPNECSNQLVRCRLYQKSGSVAATSTYDDTASPHHKCRYYYKTFQTASHSQPTTATPLLLSNAPINDLVVVNGYKYYSSYMVSYGRIVREELVNRDQAAANCSRMGLKLISIGSAAEQNQIESVINMTSDGGKFSLSTSRKEYLTSADCSNTTKIPTCRWSDGRIINGVYNNWHDPNFSDNGVTVDTDTNCEWLRRDSNSKWWYLCHEGTFVPPPTLSPITYAITASTADVRNSRDHDDINDKSKH